MFQIEMRHFDDVARRLEKYGAAMIMSSKLTIIKPGAIIVEKVKKGGKRTIKVHHGVHSVGVRNINYLTGALKGFLC